MRVGSLFSGCGGLDLGLQNAGFDIAWHCEIEEAPARVLSRHWPGIPCYKDVRQINEYVPPVDVLAGGFPCQDLSYAGKGKGLSGDRSGLWFEFSRAIRVLRPSHVIVENVPGLRNRGLGRVLYDLAEAGYVGSWFSVRASDFGAPHKRERLFILASHSEVEGSVSSLQGCYPRSEAPEVGLPGGEASEAWGDYWPAVSRWCEANGPYPQPSDLYGLLDPAFTEWMMGFPQGWTYGFKRGERLEMLGNSVHVQTAEYVGRLLTRRISR